MRAFVCCLPGWMSLFQKSSSLRAFGWCLLMTLPALGQTPKLSIESADNAGVQLVCNTVSDEPLTFEASFSLESWFLVGSATPTQRVARFRHTPQWRPDSIYYRARVGAASQAPKVVPELDLLQSDAGLLTAEEGIQLQIQTRQGVRFEFSAGTNQVTDPTPIRMTLITNFVSFPGGSGWRAAVAFEPDGFRFRQDATLRITFPTNVPMADLLAYSFDRDGSGFHLQPFDGATNTVVLSIDGFSGKGVGSFPEGAPTSAYEVYQKSTDATRAARDRAARRRNQILKDEAQGRITEQESDERQRASNLQTLEEIYRDAILPFESAARSNCDIARSLVAFDLEKLVEEWAALTGRPASENPYSPKLQEWARLVRCRCAQELIDRCEREPGVSGSALHRQLNEILGDVFFVTKRNDAQGCSLGSDAEILQRLQDGPCFGDWEGTITLTRKKWISGKIIESNGVVERTWDNELLEAYIGRVTGITAQRTFTVRGNRIQTWTLSTEGPYPASRRVLERVVTDDPRSDIIIRKTTKSTAANAPKAEGEILLRFVNGEFDSLGCGGSPIAQSDRNLQYTTIDDTEYECRPSYPKDRECPSGRADVSGFNIGLFMGFSIDTNSVPEAKATLRQRSFVLTWSKTVRFESTLPGWPPEFVEERILLNLFRK